jgi:hypothetical protein
MSLRTHRLVFLLGIFLFTGNSSKLSYGQVPSSDQVEYQVKAGFIFNFLKFVSWPEEIKSTADSWKIGILAEPPVFNSIKKTLAGKSVDGRPVEVILFEPDMEFGECHVLFISENFTRIYAECAVSLNSIPVLVVGEKKDFARTHGIIGFVKKKENLRLEINPVRAKKAGLVISGKLASLAELVGDNK